MPEFWDYLILTAANPSQARGYERQLGMRRETGQMPRVREVLVVTDLEGKRIGSGGSTLECLLRVLDRERARGGAAGAEDVLRRLRILIVHGGGDSRRLPAYAACGKIFVPLPVETCSAAPPALFDLLAPVFLDLPAGAPGDGQIVVASGDALTRFDASSLRLDCRGIAMLGCWAAPEEASRHGVLSIAEDGSVRRYLQKPSIAEQAEEGAIDRLGRSALDIGVMSFDGATAAQLLDAFSIQEAWPPAMRALILAHGLDLYREICCAMGSEATLGHYIRSARRSGSRWDDGMLAAVFPALREIPLHARMPPGHGFLHFGSTRQLVSSGLALAAQDRHLPSGITCLSMNNEVSGQGSIAGSEAWVEGCRLSAPLSLAGRNVAVGVDVAAPLSLPAGACLDVLRGTSRAGKPVWFVRCYGIDDDFKQALFCGQPLCDWLAGIGARAEDVWDAGTPPKDRTLWNARLFPAEAEHAGYRHWLWMFQAGRATAEEKRSFLAADRYSAAEMAQLADQDEFHARRARIRSEEIRRSLHRMFAAESGFSAEDLACAMRHSADPARWKADILEQAGAVMDDFVFCRVIHSLGSAVDSADLRALAFRRLHEAILHSSISPCEFPRNALRPDETIWGRAPARIELGGGWTDTPPYTLEHGGAVTNAAVNLNGQPPIHCYCRVVDDTVIRLNSIDAGRGIVIRELDELLDYGRPEDIFALAKAALAISGFSRGGSLCEILKEFGGGIELTTLVGIPKGSGLGTSSILGAVILGVIRRLTGRPLGRRELFHDVLRLEQALTTGGGWQDQIGGGAGGVKITSTQPGMFPDPVIHFVPGDLLDPKLNGGSTLLYYTGMTRLAKNILQEIVGGYLDRRRSIMAALAEEHLVARAVADALSRKDAAAFGRHVNAAWELQKRLCGSVTNEAIESLLDRVRPYVHGMRISGAGSGGFLLMICKSPADATTVRAMLERQPLNERSRFFDFEINHAGLEVTTC